MEEDISIGLVNADLIVAFGLQLLPDSLSSSIASAYCSHMGCI